MPQLKIFNNNREVHTIPGVLTPVALTSVATTSGSNSITVASTAGVYAGMPITCPNVPLGAFVSAVTSATVLELTMSLYNRTTGIWSTSWVNAYAQSSASGLTAMAHGYHPACVVEQSIPLGVWRNEIRNSSITVPVVGTAASGTVLVSGPAVINAPALMSSAAAATNTGTGAFSATPTYSVQDDTCAATPLKRHNGEPWGVRMVVSTGGIMSHFPAHMDWQAFYNGADS